MNRWVSNEEFYAQARELFRQLRNWSGEALANASPDNPNSEYLRSLIDRGKIAALRRGRIHDGRPTVSAAWVVEPFIPGTWKSNSREYIALYQAALLYTLHPHASYMQDEPRKGAEITRAFLKANGGRGNDDESKAQDKRINFLLDANQDELYNRLARVMIPLLNKSDVPVDWIQLAQDLRRWDEPTRLRWAREWFRGQQFLTSEEATPQDGGNQIHTER